MALNTEQKQEIIDRYRVHDADTGSPEVQVAILSERISYLTDHFKVQGPPFASGIDQAGGSAPPPPELSERQRHRTLSGFDRATWPEKVGGSTNNMAKIFSVEIGGRDLHFETGQLAQQASGSVLGG